MRSWLRRLVAETVIVHSRAPDSRSIQGALVAVTKEELVLERAVYLGSDGNQHPLDGQIGIPRAGISFIQRVPASPTPPAA